MLVKSTLQIGGVISKLLLFISIVACNTQTMKKYEWRPTANAPIYYPAEIVSGHFYMKDGSAIYIPTGHNLMQGWGETGAAHVVGEDKKPAPYKFDITWVSYLEEKFYGGTFELPTEKIAALFEKGFLNRFNKPETYTKIVLGLAPKGVVVVWLRGGSYATEIGRFQAKEITVAMKDFKPYSKRTLDDYLKVMKNMIIEDDIKDAIDVTNIPFGLWDAYRKKYVWVPNVAFKKAPNKELETMVVTYVNGEFFNTHASNPAIQEVKERAIPEKIAGAYTDGKYNYGFRTSFDYEELKQAFKKLYKNPATQQVNLIATIDKYNSEVTVVLQSETETIEIQKLKDMVVYKSSH